MTEFKAPPPPPANFTDTPAVEQPGEPVTPPASGTENTAAQNVSEDKMQALKSLFANNKEAFVETSKNMLSSRPMMIIVAAVFVVGLLLGAVIFGGSETPPPVVRGLEGVVRNPDITQPLKRCGRETEASAACVLYVMNHATYEKLARDFFEVAVSAMGRSNMLISVDNVRYANLKIPPGYFAEIKIPAYK